MITAVIFDLNGTLIQRRSRSIHAVQLVRDYLGIPKNAQEPSVDFFRSKNISIRSFLETHSEIDRQNIWEDYQIWEAENLDPSNIQDNPAASAIIKELSQKYKLALVTNNISNYVTSILGDRSWSKFFLYIGTMEIATKPDPKAFLSALAGLGVDPQETVAVGDNQKKDLDPLVEIGGYGIKVRWQTFCRVPQIIEGMK